MTGDRDFETLVRRHLAAEADDLPFLLDGGAVRRRLAEQRRAPWRFLALVPVAAAIILAVLVGQALVADSGVEGPGGPGVWGPLAVVPSAGGEEALNTGRLRITQTCVFLETAGGEAELLVWPVDRTRWDASPGTIGFTNSDGSEVTLRDRDAVSFGGGGDSTAESGVSGEEWAAGIDWVAPPDPSCPKEIRWYVNEVVSPRPATHLVTPAPTSVPSADLAGVIRGEPELEGGICPVLLTDDAGDRWEVYVGEGYRREYRGEAIVIIGPDGEVIARSGDRVGFNVDRDESMGSYCQAGIPVVATEIVFVERSGD